MIHLPFAYVGPGAGFAFLGSFLSLLLSLLAGIASLLLWPFRAIAGLFRKKMHARVIVLGAGRQMSGCWSTAAFWKLLAEHGVDSTVLLVPEPLPAKNFKGRWLCRDAQGQIGSKPAYYAKYLVRLLGSLNDEEEVFFSALDHQKYGVLACVLEMPNSAAILGRLQSYADSNTTICILSEQGIRIFNHEMDTEVAGIEQIGPTVLRIFGIQPPEWMEGKPVIQLA